MKTFARLGVLFLLGSAAPFTQKPAVQFSKPTHLTVANDALTGAASGDFNGDGLPDLVVGSPAGYAAVSLAAGRGAFAPPATYTLTPGRGHVAVGDANGDGAADLVFAGTSISVLLGNGDGTFQPAIQSLGSAAEAIVADFNGDGLADLASIGRNHTSSIPETVDIYPGNGDGTFGAPQTIAASDNGVGALAAADFNGDGLPDLAFGLRDIRQLAIHVNLGGFTFAPKASLFIEVGPSRTATGDLDGNGTIDLVTANFLGTISFYPGAGDGTFGAARTFAVGSNCAGASCPAPQWAALADLDANGALDVVTANQQPGSASVLLNDGTGLLTLGPGLSVLTYAYATVPGDFDGDGVQDLAVASSDAAFLDPGARVISTFANRLPPGRNRVK